MVSCAMPPILVGPATIAGGLAIDNLISLIIGNWPVALIILLVLLRIVFNKRLSGDNAKVIYFLIIVLAIFGFFWYMLAECPRATMFEDSAQRFYAGANSGYTEQMLEFFPQGVADIKEMFPGAEFYCYCHEEPNCDFCSNKIELSENNTKLTVNANEKFKGYGHYCDFGADQILLVTPQHSLSCYDAYGEWYE